MTSRRSALHSSLPLLAALPFALFLLGVAAPPPDPREIVRRHLDAIGGKARWDRVQSLLAKGTNSYSTVTFVWKQPGKVRTEERDTQYSGKTLVTAFDGQEGWMSNPFRGPNKGVPHLMSPDELRRWQAGLVFRSDLLDLPEQGVELKYLGRENVGGQPAFKLSLKRPDRDPVLLWIDAQSYLIVMRARTTASPWGGEGSIPVRIGDYRNVQGLLIPHATGETHYVVEVNPQIDDALFEPPQPLK